MKQITVRLDDEVHRLVKVRAAQDGLAMEALGRVWFEAYGRGGTVVASTETTVGPRGGGLSAGEPERERQTVALPSQESGGHPPSAAASPAPAEKPFVPDWKKGKK